MKMYSHPDGSSRGYPPGDLKEFLNDIPGEELQQELERRAMEPLVQFAKAIRYSSKLQTAIHQDKLWTDREGRVWALEEMDQSHMVNLLNWLEDKMVSLHIGAEFRYVIETAGRPWALTDATEDAIEAEIDAISQMSDYEWFCTLPLVKRLRELTGETE